ncbi:MAG: DEAD/DEAH box helicase [Actinomycetota bacterium]
MSLTELPPTVTSTSPATTPPAPAMLPFAAPHDHELDPVLAEFHPAVRTWFARAFPLGPTDPQAQAWPSIAAGNDTLVAAPTGSGKTLSAFLVAIDDLYKRHEAGCLIPDTAQVVYVSPLKALAVDISENLMRPLDQIAEIAVELGYTPPALRVGVRSGDTTSSQRSSMVRKPPEFIVTTPESLYLMVTAEKSRDALRTIRTVIVDEIHAVARDKRGSHLSLTLERLDHICGERPVRIGLSATQRPIETVARLLVGAGRERADGAIDCEIVDTGHKRHLDLELVLPDGELEALAPAEQVGEMLDVITEMILEHHTTLVFVNTRSLAERFAHQLAERLGEDQVAAHHGSLSKERRERVERKLRAGEFKALVATASLELGIDIGPIELVCQIGSPRSIATFLQRVGRSGHTRHGTPKGRLFPLSRDALVECSALLAAVHGGRLDAIRPPEAPLDILAQQIVAETAAERWHVDELFELMRGAAPYADLERETFDEVLEFVTEGIVTGRGPKGAYVHHDRVNHEIEGRRGARLASLTSGGAIPEIADYRVIADPDDLYVGSVNEDWATESLPGDIFLLGTHSWQIRRIEPGVVRVVDAGGKPPTVPFWLGEAPARTQELSEEVASLREGVQARLQGTADEQAGQVAGSIKAAVEWVKERCGIDDIAAEMLVTYLAASLQVLGDLPTTERLVIERFFDQTGGMQLVVHSPFGGRINRAFGLALRKKFCVNFDFELQAAANDDAVVLSLGPQHSFPLDEVQNYLKPEAVPQTLTQAVLVPPSPMFISRWRWNLNRSLTVLRFKGGRKNPPPIQRMEADDVMAAAFPSAAGCQEHINGPIEIPDHPIVRQTMFDTLNEGMDVIGLQELTGRLQSGALAVTCVDTVEPSPLAHELMVGAPYTFLDDAEAIDRRSRAVPLRRGLPVDLTEIGGVDLSAINRVRAEAEPDVRTADELHDLLSDLVRTRPRAAWRPLFDDLAERGRVTTLAATNGDDNSTTTWWTTTELAEAAGAIGTDTAVGEDALQTMVRGHLNITGPITTEALAELCGIKVSSVGIALVALEGTGFAIRGTWSPSEGAETEWCARQLLARIHIYSQKQRRREIEPVTTKQFVQFLLEWHNLAGGTQVRGRAGLLSVLEQLQGYEIPAGSWDTVLADRVADYRPEWLDELCLGGEVVWGRLSPPKLEPVPIETQALVDEDLDDTDPAGGPRRLAPTRATRVTLTTRGDFGWLLAAGRGARTEAPPCPGGLVAEIVNALRTRGARFHTELCDEIDAPPAEIEDALWQAVGLGLVTADSFGAVRKLFTARKPRSARYSLGRRGLRRGAAGHDRSEGRWALLPPPMEIEDPDELAEAVAEQLLARWGVVFRDIAMTENLAVPWREVLWAFRRLEARGLIRGGRFVKGFAGEQYASVEAIQSLRQSRKSKETGRVTDIAAVDPCNVTGVLLPGERVRAVGSAQVRFVDGATPESEPAA